MSKPNNPRRRTKRGSVMASILIQLIKQKEVEVWEFQEKLKINKKTLSVTLNRLLKKKLIERTARGMYSLRG